MKSSKSLYSECFDEYKLDDQTLKSLQQELLKMFIDIKNVCDENNIDYMLSGGTCLGAIRHKGFIPWDDDIDIMMLRSEYEKFSKIFVEQYSEKYILAEPLKNKNYFNKMPKVYKKNTTYIEIPKAGIKEYNMVFIDIFIIENIPDSKFLRKITGKVYDFCFKGASACIDYLYPSPVIEEKCKENKELNDYYKLRKRIGWLFSHLGGIYFWLKRCDRIAGKKRKSKMLGVPSGISYEKEVFEESIYKELITAEFCGYNVKIPAQYDKYLSNLYGDYMQIPPVEKREAHVAYKIELSE